MLLAPSSDYFHDYKYEFSLQREKYFVKNSPADCYGMKDPNTEGLFER